MITVRLSFELDGATLEFSHEAATYEEAKAAVDAQLPDGAIKIAYYADR